MAPRVHLLWCALACAARSTAERSLADPASFVVVQGLWLPPETAEADALGREKGEGPRPRALGDDGRARSGKLRAGAAPPEAVVGRREP